MTAKLSKNNITGLNKKHLSSLSEVRDVLKVKLPTSKNQPVAQCDDTEFMACLDLLFDIYFMSQEDK